MPFECVIFLIVKSKSPCLTLRYFKRPLHCQIKWKNIFLQICFFFCHPTWPSNAKTLYSVLRYWVTKASFHVKVLSLLTAEALPKRVRLFLDAACASLTDYSIFSLFDILFLRRKISINFIVKTNQYVTL